MGRIPKGRNSAVGQWAILAAALVLVAIIGYLYVGPHLDGGSGEPIQAEGQEAAEMHHSGPDVDVHVEHSHSDGEPASTESIFGDDTPAPPKLNPRPKPRTNRRKPPEKPKPTEEQPTPTQEHAEPDDAGSGGMNPTETPTEPTPTPESPTPTEDPQLR